uniref:Chromosome 19 open reading frame 38 n=1 Tax=Canis lupus dingo TaxID=286419 RepID=A0A8C0LNZ8_CANLU
SGGEMPWTVLLFAAGSLAIPAPSILLVPPHPSSQEDPIHIACVAPVGFPGANFTLYRGGQVVQFLQASADQLRVTFNVTGGDREAPGATFCCQYGVLAEHRQERLSDLSKPLQVSFPGKALPPARERESCWAQILKPQITLFSVFPPWTKTMNPEEDATPGSSGPRKRPTSTSSSPEPPEFSTFRSCQ